MLARYRTFHSMVTHIGPAGEERRGTRPADEDGFDPARVAYRCTPRAWLSQPELLVSESRARFAAAQVAGFDRKSWARCSSVRHRRLQAWAGSWSCYRAVQQERHGSCGPGPIGPRDMSPAAQRSVPPAESTPLGPFGTATPIPGAALTHAEVKKYRAPITLQ